jgi:hypothetical protein
MYQRVRKNLGLQLALPISFPRTKVRKFAALYDSPNRATDPVNCSLPVVKIKNLPEITTRKLVKKQDLRSAIEVSRYGEHSSNNPIFRALRHDDTYLNWTYSNLQDFIALHTRYR